MKKHVSPATPFLVIVAAMVFSIIMMAMLVAAHAEGVCASGDLVFGSLLKKYKEEIVSHGILSGGVGQFVITASPGGETWTVIIFKPNGQACMEGTGTDWQSLGPKAFSGQPT